ncbi:DUF4252 domain-containing protein [Algibacter sp. TI.3.09]|uniref:DUF4252 domain-containing protein n=1 Tax=Algibacter sp. TI.3.09 TaxID=3121298 RepID=UPI00311FFE0A
MKRAINHLLLGLFATVMLVSCSSGPTLQTYFVDHQEAPNFISQDLPISMLKVDKSSFTEEQNEAFNSVTRLNFIGYKANESNTEDLKVEIAAVKEILKDEKYNELIEFSDKGNKIAVKYIGTDDEADEIIIFGSSKEYGFGVVRVLGSDMNPSKMGTLVGALKGANFDKDQLKDIQNFFK